MRITYLNGGRMPSKDANSVQIAKMCEAFARNGHQLRLYAREGEGPAARIFADYGVDPLFEVETLSRRGVRGLRTAAFLARILARVRAAPPPDLFYARDPLMLMVVAHLGRTMVYESHYMPARGSVRFRLLKWLFRRPNFARLVCTTGTTRDAFLAHYPQLSRDRVLALPNAAAEIGPAEGEVGDWPGRPGRLQVGFVGRPYKGKGIETIVAAARRLGDVDFHVIGAEAADLDWLDAPLPGNFHLHGYKPHSTISLYFNRFDVAVAPYGAEVFNASGIESAAITSPLKVLEYMAAGLPLVTSDLPGVREVVEHEATGLLTAPGDVEAFAGAIERLRDDPDLRARIGTAAKARFLERHTVTGRARAAIEGI